MAGKVQMIFEGDGKKLEGELEKMRTKLRSVEAGFDKLKKAGKDTGDGVSKGMSKGAAGLDKVGKGFVNMLGPIVSVTAAIGAAKAILAEFNAERAKGLDASRGALVGFQKLAQISDGDSNKFRNLVGTAGAISVGEGTPLPESLDAVFAGASTNLTEEEMLALSPFARFSPEVQPVYRGVGKLLAGFTREEVGSALMGANKLGVAAKTSDISFAEFAPELATLGAPSRMIGIGDEDAMAALSVLSAGQGKNPDQAATQIKALMTAVRKSPKELGIRDSGLDLAGMVEAIGALPEEQRVKHFESNVRSASGLSAMTTKLSEMRSLSSRLYQEGDELTGTPDSFMQRAANMFMSPALTRSLIENRRAIQEREISAMSAHGGGELDFETAHDRAKAYLSRATYLGTLEKIQGEAGLKMRSIWQSFTGEGGEGVRDYMIEEFGVDVGGSRTEETLRALMDALRDNTEAVNRRGPSIEDNRTQINYGAPNARDQMRSPSGRKDPSTGR